MIDNPSILQTGAIVFIPKIGDYGGFKCVLPYDAADAFFEYGIVSLCRIRKNSTKEKRSWFVYLDDNEVIDCMMRLRLKEEQIKKCDYIYVLPEEKITELAHAFAFAEHYRKYVRE